jgi:hypothetical protein
MDQGADKPRTEHGSSHVYTVEARMRAGNAPTVEHEMILDAEWRHVTFQKSPIGVPAGLYNKFAEERGYFSEDAARALAWWFLAGCRSYSVEMRIVQHQFIYDISIARIGESEPIERTVWQLFKKLQPSADSKAE